MVDQKKNNRKKESVFMKILYTAFKGSTNSSKLLLDDIKSTNKLYLTNSFETSVKDKISNIEKLTKSIINE